MLEWVGAPGKPSASRLIPISVYNGEHLNDGTLYLSRPEPLALENGVEYELQSAGKPLGLFDVFSAGQTQEQTVNAWRGYGVWKPLPKPAPPAFNTSGFNVAGLDDSEPVLKRKHPKDVASASSKSGGPVDPDRPTLKRRDDSSSPTDSATQTAGGTGAVDPDRPTLHHLPKTQPNASAATDASGDALRETGLNSPDPDRPRLKRGKPANFGSQSAKLEGAPPKMQQLIAVSDETPRMQHPWVYSWANPFDKAKMQRSLEASARDALGLNAPLAKPAKSGSRKAATPPPTPLEPVRLGDEDFRSFELEYGAPPTMVFSASTPPPDLRAQIVNGQPIKPEPQKFVTLIAQPDLYGNPIVLRKSVTDAAHLDETPRMKLVDAVDAMGDNRAELLFELEGDGQRQFALYRIFGGQAERLFTTVALP
uniref:Uncharacterized protein n=1 Tax=mine drainage metagenome TaxID=410659 RepID=E6PX22_9ZZZZ